MEEEKKKGKSFLPLIIVLTLILVLSLGGVYAYFYARVNNSGSAITGRTLDIGGATITLSASRVDFDPDPEPLNDNLIPAYFGVGPTEMTTTTVNRALNKDCISGGYTGCHVWKIVATTTEDIANTNIVLRLEVDDVEDKEDWSYVVYTGTDSSATNILYKGQIVNDFPNTIATIDIHNNALLSASTGATYYVMVYLKNSNSTQNDGVTENTTDARGMYNGTVTLEAMGGEVKVNFIDTAAGYITNLYNSANKTTATVNNITYNLAPSVNLMNDRHAVMTTLIDKGDIRFYGANPNNYVWLGDTYSSQYYFYNNGSPITREAGEKKLWRIIGVFNGRLKLISALPVPVLVSWDTSPSNINGGYGINQWGPSGSYTGSDLMKLLNPGYENNQDLDLNNNTVTVNNSLYWNKGTGAVYVGWKNSVSTNNASPETKSFANVGLSAGEKNMIDTVTWYTGMYNDYSYADVHYNAERGTMGNSCTVGTSNCNDGVTRTSTWEGKVGLIYPSDFGYAADLSTCNQPMKYYNQAGCFDANWLSSSIWYNTMSSKAHSSASSSYGIYNNQLSASSASGTSVNYPVIYLKKGVMIDTDGKDGSETYPYVLSY